MYKLKQSFRRFDVDGDVTSILKAMYEEIEKQWRHRDMKIKEEKNIKSRKIIVASNLKQQVRVKDFEFETFLYVHWYVMSFDARVMSSYLNNK